MRISAIRGKNLASIEGEFEIDFTREPLASAGIFAITGPTGSGKSTILDALCLALFGKSPRQAAAREQGVELSDGESGRISQSDSRSILRKGTADGYAEADFTGLDGNLYRTSWTVRRARNKPSGNLQDFNIELLNLSSGIPFGSKKTETLKEIERLIGLNYEQFTRSVMLAQGDFTAFLKAGRDEKAALLEKLTGTDIYTEISIAIYNKSKEAETDCKLTGDQLKGITRLDQEEKTKLESREQELNLQLETTGKEYEQMRILLEWHARKENLETDIIRALEEQTVAGKKIEENQKRIDQLSLTEIVQPARTLLDGIDQLQLEITARQEQMMLKQETESSLEKILEMLKQEETESMSLLKIAEEQLEKAQPDLRSANALDVKIETLAGQLVISRKEAEEYGEAKRQSGERIAETRKLLIEAEITSNDLKEWLDKNRTREPIVENLSLIVNSLESAARAMKSANALRAESVNLSEDAGKKRAEASGWQRLIASETENAAGLKAALQNIQEEAGKYDPEKADQRLKEISVIHETLSNAENVWKSKSESLQALNRQYSVRENLNESISNASEALKPAVEKLQEARIRRDQTRLLLDHARLRTAENVEALRNTLEEDKPCPVCGNTVHPYADPGKHLKEEQSLLEKEYDLCCNQYDELMQNEARIRESLSHYALELDKANQDIPGIEKLYLDNTQKWKELKLPAKIHSAPEDEVFSAIEEMKQELRKESGELEKAVDRMNFLRKETERLRQDLEISVEKTGKLEKQVTESLHFIALLEKETKHREERIKEHEKEYSENTDRVDLWFAQPGWMENWKENQDLFVTRIREFAAAWNLKFKKLEETLQKKEISEKTLSLLESQFKETMNNFDAAMKRLEIQQQSIQELQSQRKAIFSGLAVETVEKMLNEKVTSGKKNCDAIHQKYLESLSDKNKNAGILKQIQDDLKNQTKRFEAAKAELDEWLDTFNRKKNQNISIPLLRDLLSKSVEWIDAEKKEVREWKDAVLRATTTLQERREQLKRLIQEQKEAPDKELAKKTLIGLEELKERLSAEKTGITFRLREDENNRITAGKLLADLENKLEVSEKWQKLNELLGSADGKKFRQIAQEYTLEILLGYANVQLRNLSGRYSLGVVPGTLALQVTDHDMGDEIRSVHSLSGGESFLISLALALGLASLSSGKMNVESLFIDEGFGSLDPQTLNIAMDALEQLHNQGRKVGVISHVQDMTERIQTKIHLKKIAGGKSKVLIYNT